MSAEHRVQIYRIGSPTVQREPRERVSWSYAALVGQDRAQEFLDDVLQGGATLVPATVEALMLGFPGMRVLRGASAIRAAARGDPGLRTALREAGKALKEGNLAAGTNGEE